MREILNHIERPVIVFSNGVNPLEDKPREGYHQRVAAVDSYLSAHNRIYIKINPSLQYGENFRPLGRGCLEIEIGQRYSNAIDQLVRRAIAIYSHSIYPLFHRTARDLVSLRYAPLIVDVHGIVPEEITFLQDSPPAFTFSQLESWAVLEADILVHVTNQMAAHFARKYPWSSNRNIIFPIFPEHPNGPHQKKTCDKSVVYAGGAQAWQQVDQIVVAVKQSLRTYTTTILTHEPSVFREKFAAAGCTVDGTQVSVYSARPHEVRSVYAKSSYGILCRAPHIINTVACPTKLIEYLSFGVLPIMGTPHVGDFVDMGMRYATMEQFSNSCLPVGDEYSDMVANNFIVLRQLAELADSGRKQLLSEIR